MRAWWMALVVIGLAQEAVAQPVQLPVQFPVQLPVQPSAEAMVVGNAARLVDINLADEAELTTLPGIGPKKAQAIIVMRTKKPFTRITQLLQVKGIGKKTLEKLRPLVKDPSKGHP